MQAELFHKIAEVISDNANYDNDEQRVRIESEKIRSCLEKLNKATIGRIISAAEKIADEQSMRIERDASNLEFNINDVKLSLSSFANTILRSGSLQSTLFAKTNLLDKIEQAAIEDSDLTEKIKKCVNDAINTLNSDSIDDAILSIFSQIKINLENLKYYKDHIKLPEWVGEIFIRQENNRVVADKNIDCITDLKGKISVESVYSINEELKRCFDNAESLKEAMNQNNDLLSRIESDMNTKKNAAERVIEAFERFKSSVADSVILKTLQTDDKILGRKLNYLSNALKSPSEITSVKTVEEQILCLKSFSLKSELREVKLLEELIGVKSSLGASLQHINTEIVELSKSLIRHKDKMMINANHPIPAELFIYDRSAWQSCKAFFANFSKFFIGEESHCKLYGNPDGIEELRRIVDDIKTYEIE